MTPRGESPGTGQGEDTTYADALTELEGILDSLEGDQVDVDTLAARVDRAATLIRLCRARLASARVQVEAIVEDLDDEAVDGSG